MNQTFQNSAQVLSIGIFFTLMILGLAATPPARTGERARGPRRPTRGRARTSSQAAARLDPVRRVPRLQPGPAPPRPRTCIAQLAPPRRATLTGRAFFPQLISGPFRTRPARGVRLRDRSVPAWPRSPRWCAAAATWRVRPRSWRLSRFGESSRTEDRAYGVQLAVTVVVGLTAFTCHSVGAWPLLRSRGTAGRTQSMTRRRRPKKPILLWPQPTDSCTASASAIRSFAAEAGMIFLPFSAAAAAERRYRHVHRGAVHQPGQGRSYPSFALLFAQRRSAVKCSPRRGSGVRATR